MRTAFINSLYVDQFPVFDTDGFTKKSGLSFFDVRLWIDNIPSALPVNISEIGVSGEYAISFTPNATGYWKLEVGIPFNEHVWGEDIECDYPAGSVTAIHRYFQYTAADNGAQAEFGIWVEEGGSPRLDIDSISAKIHDNAGNVIVDLGTEVVHTSEGVFKFTTPTASLLDSTPYYISIIVVRGAETWKANLGVATA